MKITTKMGDKGETSLFGGRRVSKASVFIELVGELDELQAVVGWCEIRERGASDDFRGAPKVKKILERVVDDLYRMMSIVGFEMKCPGNIKPIGEEDVEFLEKEMAKYEEVVGELAAFVRPGGSSEFAARLHIARTVCRRVERRMVGVWDGEIGREVEERKDGGESNPDSVLRCSPMLSDAPIGAGRSEQADRSRPGNVFTDMLKYLNRLSDLLFVMAYASAKLP